MSIEKNLTSVWRKLTHGKHGNTARLVAVSKQVDPELIREAYRCGQKDFGESRIQEWLGKKTQVQDECRWHFVGRLQTNKVKYLDESVTLIHSLDRIALLEALNAEGKRRNCIWQALIQVNIAEDDAKAGLTPAELPEFLNIAEKCPFVDLRGLMTIGKLNASVDDTRAAFSALRELRDTLNKSGAVRKEHFTELSMGMSGDYELALEEGATIVRVGSEIFHQCQ